MSSEAITFKLHYIDTYSSTYKHWQIRRWSSLSIRRAIHEYSMANQKSGAASHPIETSTSNGYMYATLTIYLTSLDIVFVLRAAAVRRA
jgi:hypothetical protein